MTSLNPCIFEYVTSRGPNSVLDGVSVYGARLKMGEYLAEKIQREVRTGAIDVVMPIPDSSRPAALQLAMNWGSNSAKAFSRIAMSGGPSSCRAGRSSAQRPAKIERAADRIPRQNVLLVDDSIVRGTTSREIVHMAREAGANRVIFAVAAHPYGSPTYTHRHANAAELIAARSFRPGDLQFDRGPTVWCTRTSKQ